MVVVVVSLPSFTRASEIERGRFAFGPVIKSAIGARLEKKSQLGRNNDFIGEAPGSGGDPS